MAAEQKKVKYDPLSRGERNNLSSLMYEIAFDTLFSKLMQRF